MARRFEDSNGLLGALVQWLVFETAPTGSVVELLHGFALRLCDEPNAASAVSCKP